LPSARRRGLDIFERERRVRMGQQTIKLIGYRRDLDPD
jgi:hypothetical protein